MQAMLTLYQVVAAGPTDLKTRLSKRDQIGLGLAYVLLRDFTRELLQRGFVVTFLGLW